MPRPTPPTATCDPLPAAAPGDPDTAVLHLRAGKARANAAFDALLPEALRVVADDYWTPTPVVRQVAAWLRAEGAETVVDIGSGPGKFAVALALLSEGRVVGLEQRHALVVEARALAGRCGVADRVSFIHGAFGQVPTPPADAYYLFNPFGEYSFDAPEYADDEVTDTRQARRRDGEALVRFLAAAPVGTRVVTYNGIGRRLPRCYEQVRVDVSFRGALRLWRKRATARRRPA